MLEITDEFIFVGLPSSDMRGRISLWNCAVQNGWELPFRDPPTRAEVAEEMQLRHEIMEAQKQSEARVKATINSTMLFQMTQPILDDIKHWSKEVEPALSRVGLG